MSLFSPSQPRTRDLSTDPRTLPFELGSGRPVLLLHGFTGTPFEIRPLGEALARRGYHAVGPRVAGHGLSPEALGQTNAADWFASARSALDRVAAKEPAHVIGLSMGAMLSLLLARERPDQLASLTLLAPAAQFSSHIQLFFNAFRYLPLARRIPFMRKRGVGMVDQEVASTAPYMDRVPTHLAVEVLRLMAEAREAASEVRTRTLVMYGGQDHTVSEAGVLRLIGKMHPPPMRVVKLARSGHILPLDVERERVAAEVGDFIAHCDELRG